jgi:hypothetical protein
MDESLQQLEDELKAMQPRRARADWTDRIQRELAAELPASARPRYVTASTLGSWKWLGWRTAGLAAALALMATVATISLRQAPPAATPEPVSPLATTQVPALTPVAVPVREPAAYQPVAAANVLYDLQDEGLVKADDGTTARQVRARYVDTYTWKNPRSNASIKWTVPRDEIRVMPASYNPN